MSIVPIRLFAVTRTSRDDDQVHEFETNEDSVQHSSSSAIWSSLHKLGQILHVMALNLSGSLVPLSSSCLCALMMTSIMDKLNKEWIAISFVPFMYFSLLFSYYLAFLFVKNAEFRRREEPHTLLTDKELLVLLFQHTGWTLKLFYIFAPWTFYIWFYLGISFGDLKVHFLFCIVLWSFIFVQNSVLWASIMESNSYEGFLRLENLRKKGRKPTSRLKLAMKVSLTSTIGLSCAGIFVLVLMLLPKWVNFSETGTFTILLFCISVYKLAVLNVIRFIKMSARSKTMDYSVDILYFLVILNIQLRIFIGMMDSESDIYVVTVRMGLIELAFRIASSIVAKMRLLRIPNVPNVPKLSPTPHPSQGSKTNQRSRKKSMVKRVKLWKEKYLKHVSITLFIEMMSEYIALGTTVILFWVVKQYASFAANISIDLIMFQAGLEIIIDIVSLIIEHMLGIPLFYIERQGQLIQMTTAFLAGWWNVVVGILLIYQRKIEPS